MLRYSLRSATAYSACWTCPRPANADQDSILSSCGAQRSSVSKDAALSSPALVEYRPLGRSTHSPAWPP
jgi:hypothetical protein